MVALLRSVGGRRVRFAILASAVGAMSLLVTTGEAEARRKNHRRAHAAQKGGAYAPPFAAMVVDANTGRTMYAVNEDAPRHPASVTKVMTLYLLFEQLERGAISLDTELKVSSRAAAQAPSKLGIRPGDTIEVEDAIKALVTKSANDVAYAIAENLAGSEEDFAERMTRKARQLGMSGTVYRNASGLPNPEQITTARDLTILARAVQERFPRYYRYFQTRSFAWGGRSIGNHNRLIGRVEGVDGIKTGFTNASGFNLMTSAKTEGRHVVGVVLGGRSGASRDNIMANLIRTNLARASTGGSSSVLAAAERSQVESRARSASADVETTATAPRPARLAELPPVRAAFATGSTVATASGTRTASLGAIPLPPTQPTYAALTEEPVRATAAVPPGQKIEARLPVAAAIPAPPEPPVRIERTERTERAAAPKPETEAKRETVRVSPTPWVIQLAAEDDERSARAVLDQAKSKSGRLLAKAAPFTEKVQRGGSTLYRARFSGFQEADSAQEACKSLKRSGFACFATRS